MSNKLFTNKECQIASDIDFLKFIANDGIVKKEDEKAVEKAVEEELDAFHYHEALHAAHMLISSWDEFVLNSKAVMHHPEIAELAEEAEMLMGSVYQAIGAKY